MSDGLWVKIKDGKILKYAPLGKTRIKNADGTYSLLNANGSVSTIFNGKDFAKNISPEEQKYMRAGLVKNESTKILSNLGGDDDKTFYQNFVNNAITKYGLDRNLVSQFIKASNGIVGAKHGGILVYRDYKINKENNV